VAAVGMGTGSGRCGNGQRVVVVAEVGVPLTDRSIPTTKSLLENPELPIGGTEQGHPSGKAPGGFPGRHPDGSRVGHSDPPGGSGGGHGGGPPGGLGGSNGGPPRIPRGFGGGDPPDGDSDPGGVGPLEDSPSVKHKPPLAYGTMIPTIKAELKVEQLPSWDGNHDTAVKFFWKI
jgi:hypothetical protein